MRERLIALALAAALGACGSGEAEPAGATEEPTPAPPAAEPEPSEPARAPGERDIAGLVVTVEPGGTIRVVGQDRFGGDASTVFESVQYLEGALPVLERSLTPEQVTGLRALVAELRAAAP